MRLLWCATLGVLAAWLVTWSAANGQPGGIAVAQPGKGKGKDKDEKKAKDDRSELDDMLPFAPPYERDAKKRLMAAREYLNLQDKSNIQWGQICAFLQQILNSKSDSFFDVKYEAGGKTRVNRISVKTEANRIIGTFPKEGLQFYQQLEGANASALLDEAVKANYDLAALADLSQRYFHTKAGAEGTILLATLYLERGNYLEAAYAFERLFPRREQEDVKELFTPRTLLKMCLAFKRSDDPRHATLYRGALEQLEPVAKGGLQIGRRQFSWTDLRAELDRPVELIRASALVGEWTMRGGNPARSAVVDGGPPFLDRTFGVPMLPPDTPDALEANQWIRGELDKLFVRDARTLARGVPLPGAFPVSTADLLLFRAYDGVTAVAARDRLGAGGKPVRAGEVVWRSKTTGGLSQLLNSAETDDKDMTRDVQQWWSRYAAPQANVSSILYENPLVGALAHDGQTVYFVDDVAITPPPVYSNPDFGVMGGPQFRQSGELAEMVRTGRLAAVDMRTGRLKWELGRVPAAPDADPLPARLTEEEADATTDAFRLCLDAVFLGAPTPLNGRLYVLVEQAGCARLLCLDPKNLVQVPGQTRKPALVWSQKLGKPNNTLPQDSVRRYQGATPAAGEGILVCPTNCGVVVAVDVLSRSLLWAHAYRVLTPTTPAGGRRPWNPNVEMVLPQQLPTDRWRSAGPIISGGRVLITAYDSDKLECLDLRTGKVLWWVPRDSGDLYVGGVVGDRVIVVGKSSVKAYHLTGEDAAAQKPKLAWETGGIPTPTGHGAVGRSAYYLPVRQELAGVNTVPAGEIWAINVETGQPVSKTAARKRNDTAELAKYGIGNLVFQDGMVFAQSPWEVACYPQLELKIAEMNKLLAANPNDPLGLLARGELRLDDGKLKEAVADFKAAERNGLPPEKRPVLRDKLYIAYSELLRADFNAAEGFLGEYAALCEVPAEAGEAPEDKVRREDETKRRRRDYLYLLARGRETQGKLAEAFDHYLALAALGEGKQLIDVPDEPNVQMRPDVWARGRIESMIRRAATAAARQSLEDRVDREWAAVKDGHDLRKLREFVGVFGPFFPSGREAQFKLADVLLATNNDADAREAQTHLAQLRVSADDPTVRARATDALARLMIKNRMMEDAVGLYLQLGKEYPDVVVRDGKTGADFLTSLLTDKRLLPFLEPARYPLPTRVKAEERPGQNAINYGAQFEVESPKDLFPMFRQYRFVLDQYRAGNGTWTLVGYDRATGAEKVRFPNMMAPNLYTNTPQPIPYSKFVQGNGHVMLVQLGTWVYCFDLAEKKELWNRNLLGDHPPPFQPGVQNPPVEVGPDGECTIRYPDGYVVTLGRSTVIQPGFVAVLTRDGLECVEPLTRRTLWVRKGIPDRTQLHGDARHLVLVETDAQRKVSATKLLRAVDGLAVENAPDSGRALAEARSFRLDGRHALLAGGTGDEPRTLRRIDLATGKDEWKRAFDAKAVPVTAPLNPEWAGFLKPDGTAEVVSARTGETVAALKLDAKNVEAQLKACAGVQLLADADRFYLILDRDPSAGSTNGTRPVPVYNGNMVRSLKVNGPVYAFDRATGRRLWYYADVLENQWLVLEQFADLPVLIAAAPVMRENNNQYTHAVVVIEKERGRLVLDKNVQYNGNLFHGLTVDQKNGTVSLNRFDTKIVVSPDEPKGGK
jgi:outer membrane protein assembly factor BamB